MLSKAFSALALSSLLVVTAAASEGPKTVKGPAVSVGKGKAWTWVRLVDGKPVATGVSLTEKALTGLPTDIKMPDDMPNMMPSQEFVLEFPKEIKGLPYDHMGLDWNPKGHVPPGIYDKPHFDVHFYVIGTDEQNSITATGDDLDKCHKKPDDMYVPATYIMPPGTEFPKMGVHWIDPSSPEFNGKPFTTTFIYGTYNGHTAFYEPMITLAYLQSKPNFSQDLRLPKAYDRDGYYPTRYSVVYDKRHHEFTVSLENLAMQKAGIMLNSN